MHVLTISKNNTGKIGVKSSEYASVLSDAPLADNNQGIVLLPTFPLNWPDLLEPEDITQQCKTETNAACNRLFKAEEAQHYFDTFWDNLYDASEAEQQNQSMVAWIKKHSNPPVTRATPAPNTASAISAPTLSTSGRSRRGPSFHIGQDIAVRAPAESREKYWLGKVVEVLKASLRVRWYDLNRGHYTLSTTHDLNLVKHGSILSSKIIWKEGDKLHPKTITEIKKAL